MYRPHLLLLNVLKIQGTFPSRSCICICLLRGYELPLAGVIRNSLSRPLPWQRHRSWRARTLGTACAAVGGGCRAVLGRWVSSSLAALPLAGALSLQLIAGPRGWAPASGTHHPRHIQLWGVRCVTTEQRQLRGHPHAACSCAVVAEVSPRRAARGLLSGLVTPVNSCARAAELPAISSILMLRIMLHFPHQRRKVQH